MRRLQLFLFIQRSDCVVINYLTMLFSTWKKVRDDLIEIGTLFHEKHQSLSRTILKASGTRTTGWEPLAYMVHIELQVII